MKPQTSCQDITVTLMTFQGQYGFMEIDDKRDAEDAIKDINGKNFNGGRIRIEYSNAYSGADRRGGGSSRGRDFDTDRSGRCEDIFHRIIFLKKYFNINLGGCQMESSAEQIIDLW